MLNPAKNIPTTLKSTIALLTIMAKNTKKRFLDSEAELFEAIKNLQLIAQAPELYTDMVELEGAIPNFIALLLHENTDISLNVVELLGELLDDELNIDGKEDHVIVSALSILHVSFYTLQTKIHSQKQLPYKLTTRAG